MREILFRGKWIDNGEWVYGNLNYGTIKIKSIKDSYYISDFDVNPWDKKFYPIIPESVGQYTGLTDKNGKKIFEGDIIKICGQHSCFDKVEFLDGLAGFYAVNDDIHIPAELATLKKNFIEVIDNIHDNPEMLEVSE